MRLGKFIEKYIARNTLIRLWRPLEKGNPYSDKEMLCDTIMEWEAEEIELLSGIKVIHITDIVCLRDAEAVNIVLDTEFTREEVEKAIKKFRKKYKSERRFFTTEG